ncbi:MAG TPA: hypothetical protein VFG04_30370 [Planctomycetaceae bacterium]|jgi:hypothetical protein|nr:hypothetical protein [Planctomycetaceae bacterium]
MRRSVVAWAAVLILPGCTSAAEDKDLTKLTTAQWREDLQFLARELPKRHANAFHYISRERFESEVARLDERLPRLDSDEIFVGFDRIACLIGDAHTYVRFPKHAAEMPLLIRQFGSEYRVTAVAPGLERALGTRVLNVENVPVSRAHETLLALASQDETANLARLQAMNCLTIGTALHGLGMTSNRNAAHYTLADSSGKEFTIETRAIMPEAKPKWIPAYKQPPLSGQHPGETFWYEWLPESRTIYCNFRSYKTLWSYARGLMQLIDEKHPVKVVIDLRQNGGGDYDVGLRYLIRPLSDRPEINKKGHLFVLIGLGTLSAAMSNSAHFRAQTAAILVGRPIGERPNSYQEAQQTKLPNSGLTLSYSVQFYKFVESGENLIRPDQEIVATWADFQAGRDPALEWVLKYATDKQN